MEIKATKRVETSFGSSCFYYCSNQHSASVCFLVQGATILMTDIRAREKKANHGSWTDGTLGFYEEEKAHNS